MCSSWARAARTGSADSVWSNLSGLPWCKPPALIDTSRYNATTGLSSTDDGSVRDESTDEMIPAVGKLMTDVMVMAMACDLTAVGSFQWTDTEAKHTLDTATDTATPLV